MSLSPKTKQNIRAISWMLYKIFLYRSLYAWIIRKIQKQYEKEATS